MLIEALLAVVILASGITFVIQSLVASARAARYSEEATLAINKLDNMMTRSLQNNFSDDQDLQGILNGKQFELRVKEENIQLQEHREYKQVELVALWKNNINNRKLSVNTIQYYEAQTEKIR
jgi:hypothetical protein